MSLSFPSLAVTTDWTDLVVAAPSLASVDTFVQNTGKGPMLIYWGGATAPAANDGVQLKPGESFQGNAAHIWVAGYGSTTRVSFLTV